MRDACFQNHTFNFGSSFLPGTFEDSFESRGLSFVDDKDELLLYGTVGEDIFKCPFMHVLVIDTPGASPLSKESLKSITHWVERCKMTKIPYCVIILQKPVTFMRSFHQIDKSLILPGEDDAEEHILVMPIPSTPSNPPEQVKDRIKSFIVDGVSHYTLELLEKIEDTNARLPSDSIPRAECNAWRAMFFVAVGQQRFALSIFEAVLREITKIGNASIEELKKMPFNGKLFYNSGLKWVHQCPHKPDGTATTLSVAMACVYGIIGINMQLKKYVEAERCFFDFFAFLRMQCHNEKDDEALDEWAVRALIDLAVVFGNGPSQAAIQVHIHVTLFNIYMRQSSDILVSLMGAIKDTVSGDTFPYTLNVLMTIFSNTPDGRFADVIPPKEIDIGWEPGCKHIVKVIEDEFGKETTQTNEEMEVMVKMMFHDKCCLSGEEKRRIFDVVNEGYKKRNQRLEIHDSPANEVCFVNDSIFRGDIHSGEMNDLSLTVQFPSWMNGAIPETSFLKFCMESESSDKRYFSFEKNSIKQQGDKILIDFSTDFAYVGVWRPIEIVIQFGGILIHQSLSDSHFQYRANVIDVLEPNIVCDFPRVESCLDKFECILSVDLSNHSSSDMSVFITADKCKFEEGQINLLGESSDITAEIGEKGKVTFHEKGNDEKVIVPRFRNVIIPITLIPYKLTDSQTIRVVTQINESTFEKEIVLERKFPVDFSVRILNNDIVHVSFHNNSPHSLEISGLQFNGVPIYKSFCFESGEDHFVIIHNEKDGVHYKADSEIRLSCSIAERYTFKGVDVMRTFSKMLTIQESMHPSLEAVVEPLDVPAGGAIQVMCRVPHSANECVSYEIEQLETFICIGVIKRSRFFDDSFTFTLIPKRPGELNLPRVAVNGVMHNIQPNTINSTLGSFLAFSPLV